ncbi:MAG: RteC domain-containing protein [Chryseobacterium taeanense]
MTTSRKKITMPPFLNKLYSTLQEQLDVIEQEEENILYRAEKSIHATKAAMEQLRTYISSYKFESAAEEIHFFKEIKPRFYSKLIYYLKVFNIETRRPNGGQKAEEKFLRKEMQRLTHFFDNNLEFYQYYRTGATHLDEKYFLRGSQDLYLTLDPQYFNTDPSFSTSHDYKVAKLIANELLRIYLNKAIEQTDQHNESANRFIAKPVLTWTGSKTSLIELLYALQSTGVFNNGAADVKLIATYLQEVFNVELGNYYRTFQEIRIRKGSRTQFLEQLTKQVIKRMDETDEVIR